MESSQPAPALQRLVSAGKALLAATLQNPPPFFLARWLFLRLLGLIYLIAFISLWTQIDGLIGHNGILPAADFLQAARQQIGPERYWWMPTICWLNASDGFLHLLCGSGVTLSLLVMAGVAPAASLALLWAIYLSLATVCRDFLGFQWDILLLETGFLAIFLAPRRWLPGSGFIRPTSVGRDSVEPIQSAPDTARRSLAPPNETTSRLARETPPSRIVLWLLWWLLFRLMFMSGAVKLLSNDPRWWNLTALDVHYETQPLPTWIGWYAHQLPAGFQATSVVLMFALELGLPFLIFCGRPLRLTAGIAFVFFMGLIGLTGNYCFFNLLTVALCLLLLDDTMLGRWLPKKFAAALPQPSAAAKPAPFRLIGVGALAAVILLVSGVETAARLLRTGSFPRPLLALARWVSPLRSINSYGLFAVMTTTRPEIIVEGSNDQLIWLAYEFKWKPGDLKQPPRFVEPHQPRLDWQMWFAALGDYQGNPWFINFLVRLLQGSPEVLGLLEKNPFPDAPPRYVRATLYEYRFTDVATRRAEGTWWRREYKGAYCPELTLRPQPANK